MEPDARKSTVGWLWNTVLERFISKPADSGFQMTSNLYLLLFMQIMTPEQRLTTVLVNSTWEPLFQVLQMLEVFGLLIHKVVLHVLLVLNACFQVGLFK